MSAQQLLKDHGHANVAPQSGPKQKPQHLTSDRHAKTRQLALFREKSRRILEKNSKLDCSITVEDMKDEKRNEYLADLVEYQTQKERVYIFIIVYWVVVIVLGLVAMTLEPQITTVGMFIAWGIFLGSSILLVFGHRIYDQHQIKVIIDKYGVSRETVTQSESRADKITPLT